MAHSTATTDELSDKEKETLRLIVRGHDAKSAARELDLSVHTINERLRAARRKLDVTSSREAARVLFESEGGAYENPAYAPLGDAAEAGPGEKPGAGQYRPILIGGIIAMSLLAITLALALAAPSPEARAGDTPGAEAKAASPVVLDGLEDTARDWLALIDAGDWQRSHDQGAEVFRQFMPPGELAENISSARAPLGAVADRRLEGFGSQTMPGESYRMVVFETDFAKRSKVRETVVLSFEDNTFKVSGYWIGQDEQARGSGTPAGEQKREDAALDWLALVDAGDWQASYDAAGKQFRDPNTVAGWRAASEQARVPLGDVLSREIAGVEEVNAPPKGYTVVKFRTRFSKKAAATETVTLEREGDTYRVVGYFIE